MYRNNNYGTISVRKVLGLSNIALDVLARHNIPAAVTPTNEIPTHLPATCVCKPFCAIVPDGRPLFKTFFLNAQRHIAITVISLVRHASF